MQDSPKNLSLWRLSWPIGTELLLQFLMGTADTMMVSRLGDHAVSAAGLSNQIIMSALTVFAVVNAGAGVVVARKWGAGLTHEARKAAVLSVQFSLLAGLLAGLFFYLMSGSVLSFMGAPDEVLPAGSLYLQIVGSCTVWMLVLSVMGAVIRSTGDTRGPMFVTIGMNLVHILLNAVLIFGLLGAPEMGLAGAAVSNAVSRALACLCMAGLLYHRFRGTWRRDEWRTADRPILKEMLAIGLPVSVTAVSWGYSQVVISSIISRMGAETLAAFTYLQTIQQLPWIITAAIGGALQIRIGQLHGAGRPDEMHRSLYHAIRPGLLLVTGVCSLLFLAGAPILGLFTSNTEVIRQAQPVLALCILWQPLRVMGFCASNALNVVGDARLVAAFTVFGMWALQAGGSYLLGSVMGLGLTGVFVAMLADEIFRMPFFMRRWRQRSPIVATTREVTF